MLHNIINQLHRSLAMGFFLIISFTAFSTNFQVFKHNTDHAHDLLAINDSNELVIQLGVGDGTFSSPVVISLNFTPVSVELGDFDDDGFKDLLAIDGVGNLSLSLNDGAGGFEVGVDLSVGLVVLEAITDMCAGDINGDGFEDVVLSVNGLLNGRAVVLLNDGSGGFLPADNYNLGLLATVVSIDVVDINGDGYDDMVIEHEQKQNVNKTSSMFFMLLTSLKFVLFKDVIAC